MMRAIARYAARLPDVRARAFTAALVGTLVGAFVLPHAAAAHSQPYSWVDVRVDGDSLRGEVTAHVVDLAHAIGASTPAALLEPASLRAQTPALEAALSQALTLTADEDRLAPRWSSVTPLPERHAVRFAFAQRDPRASRLLLRGPLFTYEAQHETYYNVYVRGQLVHQDLLDHEHTASTFRTGLHESVWRVARRFVAEGVHHIFIGPDHILFIVGLLLMGGPLKRLAKIVTAFTVAHSITLVLATLQIVNPSARLIEPLIALSIVIVGIENLVSQGKRDLRAYLAFAFGFVHGFGFASVLRELTLPPEALGAALFSFNLGVELGQMTIVLAVAPLLALLRRRRPAASGPVLAWGSCAVIAAGAFWFVQRVWWSA